MYRVILFLSLSFFGIKSFAVCSSFVYGRHKGALNEFSSFDCKTKKLFYNSDLFLLRKTDKFFIGELQLSKNTKKLINTKFLKKLKKTSLKEIKRSHSYYILVNSVFYKLPIKSFLSLKKLTNHKMKKAKKLNGLLITSKKKFPTLIRDSKISKKAVNFEKLKILDKRFNYAGLYWLR